MALQDLLEALEAQAEAEVRGIWAEAEAEAERISVAGRAAVEERRAASLRTSATAREEARASDVAAARYRARQRVLAARAALLDRVLEAARAELETPEGLARWVEDALPALLVEARAYLPDGKVTLRCPASVAAAVRAVADATTEIEVDAEASGMVLKDESDRLRIDLSPRSRLDATRASVLRRLAGLVEVT